MIIRMIPLPNTTLYIYGHTEEGQIIFRTSHNIQCIQSEKIEINQEMCYFSSYFIPEQILLDLPLI